MTWKNAYETCQGTVFDLEDDLNALTEERQQLEQDLEFKKSEISELRGPIAVDLVEGWNMIGYTLRSEQDVAATMHEMVVTGNLIIVKDNFAEVYWPEFGFNGIGDFIPGQGYQVKIHNEHESFTYLETDGQRMELMPTVPEWVHDLEVEKHPNDIRTLVKVVNMLGQEVDPEKQFKGEVLLYLYNDATVEKKLVK